MPDHLIAFWNVENLFGPQDHPHRIDWIRRKLASQLDGWTDALYRRKIEQLGRIIAQMKGGQGPDILGVCEVEDGHVLGDLAAHLNGLLPARSYVIVHADNEHDQRGIDTAFLYDSGGFSVDPKAVFNHFVVRRTGTRDILQATFSSLAGNDVVLLCNHWPARSGGAWKSAGFRATAGETLAYWHERIREVRGEDTAVIAFGDFNDDPWDPSMVFNANSTREQGDVVRAQSARFYNCAWEYLNTRATDHHGNERELRGSLYFGGDANVFDQILVGRPLLDAAATPFKMVQGSARIEAFPEMVSHRNAEGPRRFGMAKGNVARNVDETGFSDHFPVSVLIAEAGN